MAWVNVGRIKGDTGNTGAKGDTGATGPVNLASTLDTSDNTNAIKNAPVATAIQDINKYVNYSLIKFCLKSNIEVNVAYLKKNTLQMLSEKR